MSTPTPFVADAPLGSQRAIIRRNPENSEEIEMIEARWGSNPRFADGESYRFIRSEGKTFPSHRCLVPASEFHITVGERRYRVTLDGGNFLYLAAVWEPAMRDWPLSYRVVTIAANPDVARYLDRHGAIIQRRQNMQWLDGLESDADLLTTPPARTFVVEDMSGGLRQAVLAL